MLDICLRRLQVTTAKILQSLPEMKRDGSTVLASIWTDTLYGENSTLRAGALLSQLEFIPKVTKQLQEQPAEVITALQEIRECSKFGAVCLSIGVNTTFPHSY